MKELNVNEIIEVSGGCSCKCVAQQGQSVGEYSLGSARNYAECYSMCEARKFYEIRSVSCS